MSRKLVLLLGMLLALGLAAAACLPARTQTQEDLLSEVKSRGTVRVSTDPAYPPQSFLEGEEMKGFDVDVAKEVARRMEVEVEWQTADWDLIVAGSWQGRWDLSVGSMTITPERQEVLHFTQPYYFTPAAAAVHQDNTTIRSADTDLDGKRIGVCGGCTYEFYLDKTLSIPGEEVVFLIDNAQVVSYDTDSSAIQDLALGDGLRLDAVISALPTLKEAIDSGLPLKLVGDPIFYEPLAAAVDRRAPKDPTRFVQEVDRIIGEMHQDGTLTQLSLKWYGVDLTKRQ